MPLNPRLFCTSEFGIGTVGFSGKRVAKASDIIGPSFTLSSIFLRKPAMGNRLSKIVTRTGDSGTTGLGDGTRVAKDDLRMEVIGEVDELNSSLGVLLSEEIPDTIRDALLGVQPV